ncbi:MAG: patatin-like phospholipase family protein [Afipia sp.]|nr:patatin-like phospholipase family protein [Afipia sp.]
MSSDQFYYGRDDIEKLLEREKEEIARGRERYDANEWTGVALSGGGIRSAIFCLGALQALGANGVLKNFDYMSSVSGGGYIASALQWLWRTDASSGTQKSDFPFGVDRSLKSHDELKDKRLSYLRNHGKYLTPGNGLSIWSMTAVTIRTLFLNLITWLPVAALAMWVCVVICRLFDTILRDMPNFYSPILVRWQCGESCAKTWPVETFFGLSALAGFLGVIFFTVWALGFALDTMISPAKDRDHVSISKRRLYLIVQAALALSVAVSLVTLEIAVKAGPILQGLAITTTVVALLFVVVRVLQVRGADMSMNYEWRRAMEVVAGSWLPRILIAFAISTIPVVPYLLANNPDPLLKLAAAATAAVSGLVSAFAGHGAQAQNKPPSNAVRWILMAASGVFIYALGIGAYLIAQLILCPECVVGSDSTKQNLLRGAVLGLSGVAIFLTFRTNVNYVGLHRFYRDRLMEAFMPSTESVQNNLVGASPDADRLSLSELWPPRLDPDGSKRPIPFPILNTNAVLVNDPDRTIMSRGGDSFVLTPLHMGSPATGWEVTTRHISKHGPISLASGMAASGAALNANAAYVGAGVTRDRLLSIVLMLLNLRLGLWVGRPNKREAKGRIQMPNHFNPGFRYGMTLSGFRSDSSFIELSDGGHFDNLGIYELIRRKVSIIVTLDGEQDAPSSMPALYSVVQRVAEDFNVRINLEGRLDELISQPHPGYPDGVRFVRKPFFAAPIEYPDGKVGVLVYVKLSLASDASFAAKGYRAQYPDFPHQSTTNQFFVPQQIEAYRDVGYINMKNAIDTLGLGIEFEPAKILVRWDRLTLYSKVRATKST